MTAERTRLPNRRRSITEKVETPTGACHMTVGFGDDLRPREIFLRPAASRSGSAMQFLADDAAILVSLALQYGVPVDAIAGAMSRTTAPDGSAAPASLLGAAADLLLTCLNGGGNCHD